MGTLSKALSRNGTPCSPTFNHLRRRSSDPRPVAQHTGTSRSLASTDIMWKISSGAVLCGSGLEYSMIAA